MYTINSKVFQLSTISTDSSIIMADNNDTEIEKCLYCPKTFTGLNNYNRDKHIESYKNKNGTPKGGNRNIISFLKSSGSSNKKSPSVSLSLDISSPHYSI